MSTENEAEKLYNTLASSIIKPISAFGTDNIKMKENLKELNDVVKTLSNDDELLELIREFVSYNAQIIIKAIDILTFNTQRNFPINEYKNFFESLRIIFPIQSFRIAYQEGMKINKIKVLNHNSLIKWYLNLGTYILKNLK